MKKLGIGITLATLLPAVAFAQGGDLGPLKQLLASFGQLVGMAIPILIGVVLLYFIWEGYHYMHDPQKTRENLIAGVVALFVIVSIWGIVLFMQRAFLGSSSPQTVPAPHYPTN